MAGDVGRGILFEGVVGSGFKNRRNACHRQEGILMFSIFSLGGILAVAAVIYVSQAIRIVRQFEKGLVETFGQYSQTVSAGLVLIFPPFQSLRKVDMREQVMEVPPQEVITKDNASVQVDAVFYFQVADPVKVVYNVANFAFASFNLAQTNLRNIIGEMDLDQPLTT